MLDVQHPYITYAIMVLTILLSWQANQNPSLKRKLIFYPFNVKRDGEFYRFITGGLIHADWMHLFINMFVLFSFGAKVEFAFLTTFGALGWFLYPLLYFMAIPLASTYSYIKHHDNAYYMALGASGAVSAVVFASILFDPTAGLVLLFFPFFPTPAFIMGLLYLLYSSYMAKRASDNIGHDAHFYGAVFGFLFPLCFKPKLIVNFINLIEQWVANLLLTFAAIP